MIGSTLGHYRIEAKLGEGGMGVVYKARDQRLDRFVALKVLPSELSTDPARRRRFMQEAKAACALNHPNIVTIHEIDSADGADFIVMELIQGKTLRELIPSNGLPLRVALKYAVHIADALSAAHEAGVIHRDLKPANIMVASNDEAHVLDFGIAKVEDRAEVSEHDSTRTI